MRFAHTTEKFRAALRFVSIAAVFLPTFVPKFFQCSEVIEIRAMEHSAERARLGIMLV
jgi:hypothetical protein